MGEENDEEKDIGHSSEKLQWHPAFLDAIKQELFDYSDSNAS